MVKKTITVDIEEDGAGEKYVFAKNISTALGAVLYDPALRFTAVGPLHTNTFRRDKDAEPLVCNFPLRELLETHSYVDAVALELDGEMPDSKRRAEVADKLIQPITDLDEPTFSLLKNIADSDKKNENPSLVTSELLMVLARGYDKQFIRIRTASPDTLITKISEMQASNKEICFEVSAFMPLLLAIVYRVQNGTLESFSLPDKSKLNGSYAANLAYMMFGDPNKDAKSYEGSIEEAVFDTLLTITIDGGQNAAITAAEVAASTDDRGNNPCAVQSVAVITRSGNLHGGACKAAYEELLKIQEKINSEGLNTQKAVSEYINERLEGKNVIYGFGTRKTNASGQADARSTMLKESIKGYLKKVEGDGNLHYSNDHISDTQRLLANTKQLLEIAEELEQQVKNLEKFKGRLFANYDLYSGILLGLSGIDPTLTSNFMYTGRAPSVMQHVKQYVEEAEGILSARMLST